MGHALQEHRGHASVLVVPFGTIFADPRRPGRRIWAGVRVAALVDVDEALGSVRQVLGVGHEQMVGDGR